MNRARFSLRGIGVLGLVLLVGLASVSLAQDPSGRPSGNKGAKKPTPKKPQTTPPVKEPITITLTILTDPPESEVLINGEARGVTNAEGKKQFEKLQLGRYSVEVRKDGYAAQLKGFQAGSEAPTLVFKLEPKLDDIVKQFDALLAEEKLIGPESPNALEVVKSVATKFPDRPEVARMKSVLATHLSRSIAPMIRRSAEDWRSMTRDELARGVEKADVAISLNGGNDQMKAEAAYLRGVLALRRWERTSRTGDPGQPVEADVELKTAREEMEAAVKLNGSMAVAHYQLGVVLLHSREAAAAEAAFTRTIQLEGGRAAFAQCGLGAAYFAQNKYAESIEAYKKATEIEPNSASAFAGMGLARAFKGDTKQGVKDIERAIQLDPSAALPHYNLGRVYSRSKNSKEKARGLEELKKAVELNAQNVEFQNREALTLIDELQKQQKKK